MVSQKQKWCFVCAFSKAKSSFNCISCRKKKLLNKKNLRELTPTPVSLPSPVPLQDVILLWEWGDTPSNKPPPPIPPSPKPQQWQLQSKAGERLRAHQRCTHLQRPHRNPSYAPMPLQAAPSRQQRDTSLPSTAPGMPVLAPWVVL